MKATGIVRKIDDLGRVVIPKEIRKNMHIREGDNLEIFTESKGEIVLKKYAPMGEFINISQNCAQILNDFTDLAVCITDTENIIATSGNSKSKYMSCQISDEILEKIEQRKTFIGSNNLIIPIVLGESNFNYASQIVVPIISNTDLIGSIVLFSLDNSKITSLEVKLAESFAKVLGSQIE